MTTRRGKPKPAGESRPRDDYDRMVEIDKASAVMLRSAGIVDARVAKIIADAVTTLAEKWAAPGAPRTGDYLPIEHALIAIGGLEAGRVHTGRARVCLNRTHRRLAQREACLSAHEALLSLRERMLALGEAHAEALIPGYTLGVQAQPTSFGHYVSGCVTALERATDRLKWVYGEINRCPLGVAALGTSSFPMDRKLLSDLLGFDAPLENSFDAGHIATLDTGLDIVGAVSTIALTIGVFIGDLERQYRFPTPWLTLKPGAAPMSISTLMPQKRNPDAVNRIRTAIGELLGVASGYRFKTHNVTHGGTDHIGDDPDRTLAELAAIARDCVTLVDALQFNEKRALEEIRQDYGTATELVSTLQRAGVPLFLGHAFVSKLVDYGRARGLKPDELPFEPASEIFAAAAEKNGYENTAMPLDEDGFRKALTAREMVRRAKGLGGPQPAEVRRMLRGHGKRIAKDRAWEEAKRAALAAAGKDREKRFARLRNGR